jgi:hypothetical protein
MALPPASRPVPMRGLVAVAEGPDAAGPVVVRRQGSWPDPRHVGECVHVFAERWFVGKRGQRLRPGRRNKRWLIGADHGGRGFGEAAARGFVCEGVVCVGGGLLSPPIRGHCPPVLSGEVLALAIHRTKVPFGWRRSEAPPEPPKAEPPPASLADILYGHLAGNRDRPALDFVRNQQVPAPGYGRLKPEYRR